MNQRRKTILTLALLLVLAVFVVDRVIISPFIDLRAELIGRRDNITQRLEEAKHTLALEKQFMPMRDRVEASAASDASAVESQLLHQMHDWQQRAGVSNASFQRSRTTTAHGFTCLTFTVSANGSMMSVAGLVYEMETAAIPLRVDDLRVVPTKHDGGDELQLRLSVSTLCRQMTAPKTTPVAAMPMGELP